MCSEVNLLKKRYSERRYFFIDDMFDPGMTVRIYRWMEYDAEEAKIESANHRAVLHLC